MDKSTYTFENILNPAILKQNLIFVSLFISLYESFKSSIINNVKYFYWSGYENGVEEFDGYEEKVLSLAESKKNRQIKGTLLWLKLYDAISDKDMDDFKAITDIRNQLTHDMMDILFKGLPEKVYELYVTMLKLFEKITKWWIKEIDMAIDPDITPEQYNSILWDEVTSINLLFIKIMAEIALTDTPKYYDMFFSSTKEDAKANEVNNNSVHN